MKFVIPGCNFKHTLKTRCNMSYDQEIFAFVIFLSLVKENCYSMSENMGTILKVMLIGSFLEIYDKLYISFVTSEYNVILFKCCTTIYTCCSLMFV